MSGECEEDVVQRWLMDLHVIDGYARVVERAHDRAGEPGGGAHGGAKAPSVVADMHRAVDERVECRRGGRVRRAECELQARSADLALQLRRGAAGDHTPV